LPPLEAITEQKTRLPALEANTPAVLFDFDGTLGDTEVPAMEVAFWELAPYLPELAGAAEAELDAACPVFVRANAGKAFEHMIEKYDKQRGAAGLRSIEETRTARDEPFSLLAAIDGRRAALGLETIAGMRIDGREPLTLLMQQKEDTVVRLAKAARPTPGTLETLEALRGGSVPFVIATTSGKPRVPVCVDTAGLRSFFPSDEKDIHSGESDFDPPKFKPAPDVYLRAAASVGRHPSECIAVEDSASGVGSASNAGIGLIVGYVGGGHIQSEAETAHARMLMAGEKAQNKRGADIVITHMQDLPQVVKQFAKLQASRPCRDAPLQLTNMTISDPAGSIITRD
jgi:beta-phosphoglucomutase-like phosphatase (HAD superfamily)